VDGITDVLDTSNVVCGKRIRGTAHYSSHTLAHEVI